MNWKVTTSRKNADDKVAHRQHKGGTCWWIPIYQIIHAVIAGTKQKLQEYWMKCPGKLIRLSGLRLPASTSYPYKSVEMNKKIYHVKRVFIWKVIQSVNIVRCALCKVYQAGLLWHSSQTSPLSSAKKTFFSSKAALQIWKVLMIIFSF